MHLPVQSRKVFLSIRELNILIKFEQQLPAGNWNERQNWFRVSPLLFWRGVEYLFWGSQLLIGLETSCKNWQKALNVNIYYILKAYIWCYPLPPSVRFVHLWQCWHFWTAPKCSCICYRIFPFLKWQIPFSPVFSMRRTFRTDVPMVTNKQFYVNKELLLCVIFEKKIAFSVFIFFRQFHSVSVLCNSYTCFPYIATDTLIRGSGMVGPINLV